MNRNQYRFLKEIRYGKKSAQEICQNLGIKSKEENQSEDIGGYYNALNNSIGYLVSDEPGEIDNCFEIESDKSEYSNRDFYIITKYGINKFDKEKERRRNLVIGITAITVAVIGVLVNIFK